MAVISLLNEITGKTLQKKKKKKKKKTHKMIFFLRTAALNIKCIIRSKFFSPIQNCSFRTALLVL